MSAPAIDPPVHFNRHRIGKVTEAEYLAFLKTAQRKYEYINGEGIERAGASPEHNQIAANTLRAAGNLLE